MSTNTSILGALHRPRGGVHDGKAPTPHHEPVRDYLFAFGATLVAAMGREALSPVFGHAYPFTTLYLAVVASAWVGGRGPGLMSTVLGGLAALWVWTPPEGAIGGEEARDILGLVLFVTAGVAICLVIDSLRQSVAREQRVRAEAQVARAEAEALRAEAEAAQVRAEAAVHAREEIQAIVAHDLRNPLGVILMQARLLEKAAPPGEAGEPIRQALTRVLRSTRRMSSLIRDLLDAATIEAQTLAIEPRADDASAIVEEAVAMVAPLAEARHIAIVWAPPGRVPLRCDRERVLQVLGNLLGNAIKFTPEGGSVTVEITAGVDRVRLSVADTGPGIGAEQLPHIFDRYWRGKRSAGGGTGLGLFIAHGIVEAHGGTIEVRSNPGIGTTFSVELPCDTGVR